MAQSIQPCQATKAAQGWVLERQNHFGRAIIYANNRGVLVTYPQLRYNVLTTAPDWNVLHFNTQSKKQFKELRSAYLQKSTPVKEKLPPNIKGLPVRHLGLAARKFSLNKDKGEMAMFSLTQRDSSSDKVIGPAQYFVTEPVDLPEGDISFLSAFYHVPNLGGIPLELDERKGGGLMKPSWYTISIKRQAIPDATFVAPKNFTTVRSQMEVYGGALSSPLDEMAEDLGLGVKFGK